MAKVNQLPCYRAEVLASQCRHTTILSAAAKAPMTSGAWGKQALAVRLVRPGLQYGLQFLSV
jgi:hypothetical protein